MVYRMIGYMVRRMMRYIVTRVQLQLGMDVRHAWQCEKD
jgi:hypothetical protein